VSGLLIQDANRSRRKREFASSCRSVAAVSKKQDFFEFFTALWTASPTVRQPPAGWLCDNGLPLGSLSPFSMARFLFEPDQTCDVTARGPR